MHKAIWAFVGLVVAAAATSAVAVGKVTVDPNKPGAKIAMVAPEIDSRLDKKVTYEARRKTVSAILADLSEMTGVTLHAGYNKMDWQTRDRRMNIFAKDTPLKSLMNSIAHVMKFKWSKTDQSGTWTYRLYMDRKTLLGAERQRLIEEERLLELESKQREKVIDELTRTAAMSDQELEKLKQDCPYLYLTSKMGWRYLLPALFAEVPAAMEAWSAGEYLSLNGNDLPPQAQQALLKTIPIMSKDLAGTIGPGAVPPEEALNDLGKLNIQINIAKKMLGYRGDTAIGDVTIDWPGSGVRTGFLDTDSEVAKKIGLDYIRAEDNGPMGEQEQGRMNQGHEIAVEEQKTDFLEPVTEHPEDPALLAKVKLKIEGNGFIDLLKAVAKASGLAVVSDSFAIRYLGFDLAGSEVPLKEVLNKIALQYRYNWDKQNSVIEFRDRGWFRKRSAQVPEAWLEPWRAALRDTGTLNIDQLSQMACLNDEQAHENIYCDGVLNADGLMNILFNQGDLLKAYACLDDLQQSAVFSDVGLQLAMVSPDKWPTVARMFRFKPLFNANPDAGITLIGKLQKAGKLISYTVTASTPVDTSPIKWQFTTPCYNVVSSINSLPWRNAASQSRDVFDEARKARLSDPNAWYKLGMVLCDCKYYPQTLEALGYVTSSDKARHIQRFIALTWTGHILDLLSRRDSAIAAYKQAISFAGDMTGPSQYGIIIDRSWLEQRLKSPFERPSQQIEEQMDRVADQASEWMKAKWTKEQVKQLLDNAEKLGIQDQSCWINIAAGAYRAGWYQEALIAMKQIERLDALHSSEIWQVGIQTCEGIFLDLLGQRTEALKHYREGLKTAPKQFNMGLLDRNIDRGWVEERLKTPFERK